jgi:hypothetical protein
MVDDIKLMQEFHTLNQLLEKKEGLQLSKFRYQFRQCSLLA